MMKNVLNGELFEMHKPMGALRKTVRYITCEADIPGELIAAKAVVPTGDQVVMVAVESTASRPYPFYLAWEKTEKLACGYGAWPKDNGATTLIMDEDGLLYDKAVNYTAALLIADKPIPEHFAKNPSITVKNGMCSVLTSWGEISEAPVPVKAGTYTAVLIDYRDGSVNLLTLSEESAKAYIVVDENGNDIGRLTDIVK